MRRISMCLALLCVLASNVHAQSSFWVESFNKVTREGKYTPQVDGQAVSMFTPKVGVFSWALVNNGWAEAIVGVHYVPTKHLELDLGTGVETDKNPSRLQAGAFLSISRATLYTAYEIGGSGYWYLAQGNVTVVKKDNASLGVGFRFQRFAGIGPRVQVEMPKAHLTVWASGPMFDPEDHKARNVIVGLKLAP